MFFGCGVREVFGWNFDKSEGFSLKELKTGAEFRNNFVTEMFQSKKIEYYKVIYSQI